MKKILFSIYALIISIYSFGQTNTAKWWVAIPSDTTTLPTMTNGMWRYNNALHKFTFYENGTYKHLNAAGISALAPGHIFVGNGSSIATDVALSGDGTLSTSGTLTVTGLQTKALPSLTAGFLKYTGSAWTFDNSTYLTTISGISAGGDLSGTYPNPSVVKINGTLLSGLSTGILKNTTGTGIPSIAVAGDFPTLNQNTTGSAATLTTARNIAITGDGSWNVNFDGSGNVTSALTLTTVNSNVGSFGSATQSGTFTVDGKGRITAASNVTITPAVGSITGLGTGVATALGVNTGSSGAFVVNGGALGTPSSGTATNLTGLPATTGLTGIVPIANGGTNKSSFTTGSVIYFDGSQLQEDNANHFWDGTNHFLGIGNTVPLATLHTATSSTSSPRGVIFEQNSTGINSSMLNFYKSRGSFGSKTVIVTGDLLGNLTFKGYDGTNFTTGADILITSTGTISSGIVQSTISMRTANSSGTLTSGFSIDGSQLLTFPAYTTNGGLFFGNGSGVVSQTGAGTSTTILHGGTSPSYSPVSLTADVSGILPLAGGGTNANLTASNGGIFYSTASAGAILSGTATANKILLSGATAAPTWSTSTIPSSAGATANKALISDGTNYVLAGVTEPNSATTGDVPYASSSNVYSNLAANSTATKKYLQSLSSGVPSWQQIDFADLSSQSNAWLTASGGTLTGVNTITSNAASQLLFPGTWTASANNQYHFSSITTQTARSTASDGMGGWNLAPKLIAASTSQDLVGLTVDANLYVVGAINTIGAFISNTTAGCTNGTSTNVTANTYTNLSNNGAAGTGALWTVVVSGNAITSVTNTTAGSGYAIGDSFTFNGSSFGGSGSYTIRVATVVGNSLGANATTLRLKNYLTGSGNAGPNGRFIDFVNGSGTNVGSIENNANGLTVNDVGGLVFTTGGTGNTFSFRSTVTVSAAGGITTGQISPGLLTILGSNSSGGTTSSIQSGNITSNNIRLAANNINYAGFIDNSAYTLINQITAGSITAAGSGYVNATYTNVPLTGGSGTTATATVVVSGGAVTSVTFPLAAQRGKNFKVNDVLSASNTNLGGSGSGFTWTVSQIDYTGDVFAGWMQTWTHTDNGTANKYVTLYQNGTVNQLTGATGYYALAELNATSTAVVNGYGVLIRNTYPSSFGLGATNPTALVHIGAGTTTQAPFGLTSGTNLTSASNGKMEYDGINLMFTPAATIRKTVSLYQVGRATAQTAANASVVTWTVGANDGTFKVSANVLVTTSTVHNFTVTCAYTDEGNTARTITLNFSQLAGTFVTAIANAAGAVPYEGVPLEIRCKSGTTITIASTGTFTTVTYNIEGSIAQIN